ncbi:MAG: hypothetical protein ACR2O6_05320 [Ilumatobacteraceae bacterium]
MEREDRARDRGDATDASDLGPLMAEIDDEIDVDEIAAEEAQAARRLAAIEAGRRKGGIAGAAMAGVMLSLQEIYQGPVKDDTPVAEAEAPGDPDEDGGIRFTVDDVDVWVPPSERDDDG